VRAETKRSDRRKTEEIEVENKRDTWRWTKPAPWSHLSGITSVWGLTLVITPVLIYSWAVLLAQVNRACAPNLHMKCSDSHPPPPPHIYTSTSFFLSFYSRGIHLHKFHVTVGCGYIILLPSCIPKGTARGEEEVTAPDIKVFCRRIGLRFPAGTSDISLLHGVHTGTLTCSASYPMNTGGKAAGPWSW
jgi:hypothetical protein